MTPESFNAALAQRKLEAIDILLVQARMGSNPDRIRAASAILRMAFIPERATDRPPAAGQCTTPKTSDPPREPDATACTDASQAEGLQASSRRQSDESSRSAAAGKTPNPSPTPQGPYSQASDTTIASAPTHTSAPALSSA